MAAAEIDRTVEGLSDLTQETMDAFDRIEAEIIATPATTIEDLRVKARAACWALLGDLDSREHSADKRMALSIVRDLIRMYDPDLERPGAVKKLVEDIEQGDWRVEINTHTAKRISSGLEHVRWAKAVAKCRAQQQFNAARATV
jgi:hypothetical protein